MKLEDIVKRVVYYRDKQKISARELSLMIGKDGAYINKFEKGCFNLPMSVLLEILEALDIKEEEFFANNYQTYNIDKEIYNAIKNLPTTKKQNLINLIKR